MSDGKRFVFVITVERDGTGLVMQDTDSGTSDRVTFHHLGFLLQVVAGAAHGVDDSENRRFEGMNFEPGRVILPESIKLRRP